MRLLGVLAVLAACHGGGGGEITPDAAISGDADAGGRLGLFVAWEPDPQVPGPLTTDITASEVAFQVRSLQFLSDSGDASRGNFTLRWNSDIEPNETTLPTAPAGLYSQVSIHLGGGTDSAYRVVGTWRDPDDDEASPFRIEDPTSITVMLDCAKLLPAAGSTEVAIKIDLSEALEHVRFDGLPKDETGAYMLNPQTDPLQLDALRKRIPLAFRLDN